MKLLHAFVAAQSIAVIGVGAVVLVHTLKTPVVLSAVKHGRDDTTPRPKPGAKPEEAKKEAELTPPDVVKMLLAGNDRFVADHPSTHHFFTERKTLAGGQHPKAIVLSCSDSRLPPELIFDQSLGDLFVVRSAGNVADKIGIASMEYAAEHLGSKVLVVLGHEKCGAVTAAAKGGTMPTENLKALMDEISPSLKDLRGKYEGEELVHFGVEANVDMTADEVLDRSPLLRELVEKGELIIIQAVYDIDSGHVREVVGPEHALAHVHEGEVAAPAGKHEAPKH
jgi:carbonic anhydrase